MADLIVRGATIVDGTGSRPFTGDIELTGDIITAVGDVAGSATRTIDADGLVVTPGFVDIHTHFDGQLTWDQVLAPSSLHGVTTIAVGNCGVGFAPAAPDRHDWLIGLLEGVEDIPGAALAEGLSWDWETFPEYLDALARRSFTVDVGAHIPHAALRAYVMGEAGADHTVEPSESEIERMALLVREGLDAGAVGFATSRTEVHRTNTGANIGTLTAGSSELLGIAAAMREAGTGVVQLISDLYQTPDDSFCDAELDLLRQFVEVSGRPLSFTMQQAYHSPDRWKYQMDWVDSMVERGHDVKAQVAPRPIGVLIGLAATAHPFMFCGSYGEIAAVPLSERVTLLRDPERRRLILSEHAALAATLESGILRQIMCGFDVMFRLTDPVDYEMDSDRSLGADAGREGVEPVELVYDALLGDAGDQLLYLPLFNFARGDFDDIFAMLSSPNVLLGLSDAGAHCGAICDASNTTSSLALWARDRRGGERIPLERMVHLNTARNARHMGWFDRGVLAPGYLADLNLIDFERLNCRAPHIVHDLPAGGRRLMQAAEGYRFTIKSGLVTFEGGEHSNATPGGLIRGTRSGPR